MKKLFFILTICSMQNAQSFAQKWWHTSNNDIATMSCELGAGYAQGWREEVLYHPNALLAHFPNLNPNFWDNRISWQRGNIRDANHILKFSITGLHIAAVVIHSGDLKKYKVGKKILKIVADLAKHYVAYQAGFFLSYNLTHKNKL